MACWGEHCTDTPPRATNMSLSPSIPPPYLDLGDDKHILFFAFLSSLLLNCNGRDNKSLSTVLHHISYRWSCYVTLHCLLPTVTPGGALSYVKFSYQNYTFHSCRTPLCLFSSQLLAQLLKRFKNSCHTSTQPYLPNHLTSPSYRFPLRAH